MCPQPSGRKTTSHQQLDTCLCHPHHHHRRLRGGQLAGCPKCSSISAFESRARVTLQLHICRNTEHAAVVRHLAKHVFEELHKPINSGRSGWQPSTHENQNRHRVPAAADGWQGPLLVPAHPNTAMSRLAVFVVCRQHTPPEYQLSLDMRESIVLETAEFQNGRACSKGAA